MPPIIIYSWFLIFSIASVKASLKPSDVKVAPATMSILSSLCLALTSSTNFVQQTPPMTSVSPCSTWISVTLSDLSFFL